MNPRDHEDAMLRIGLTALQGGIDDKVLDRIRRAIVLTFAKTIRGVADGVPRQDVPRQDGVTDGVTHQMRMLAHSRATAAALLKFARDCDCDEPSATDLIATMFTYAAEDVLAEERRRAFGGKAGQ